MRLRTVAVTAGLITIVAAGTAAGLSEAASKAPARMLVYAQEWSLWPSRSAVPAGHAVVQLWNRGEDAHDLRIRRLDSRGRMTGRAQGVRVTQSGKLSEASWRLKPGRYELYCSMPGHLSLGMHAKLRVR
jgi:plastocyanin